MKREISIEDGFQVVMIFLEPFFLKVVKKDMIKKGLIYQERIPTEKLSLATSEAKFKDKLHEDIGFFFLVVCDGSSSDKYFETVVEHRLNIPPLEQHKKLIIKEDMLFQLTIDFCEYFNKRFQEEERDSLRFAIDWLKGMRKHPDEHQKEWEMWNQVVIDVTKHGQKSLGFF